tara:strand:+ start:552 stop:683 length:132 start_codon:yes stop_codon:yes gene_type:complete
LLVLLLQMLLLLLRRRRLGYWSGVLEWLYWRVGWWQVRMFDKG